MGCGRYMSWSYTRSYAYNTCRRQFFYEYFPKYEKYDAVAYMLKNLSAPELIAGQVVDWSINGALENFIEHGELPEDLAERGIHAFRRVIAASERIVAGMKAGRRPPRQSQPLHSDYYGYPLPKDKLAYCEQLVQDCLYNFEVSEVVDHLIKAKPDRWGKIKKPTDYPPHFRLGELIVYANYDIYFELDDCLYIIDWKTARPTEQNVEKARQQLSVYALYGHEHLHYPPERIYVQAVWLQQISRWNPSIVMSEAIGAARQTIATESAEQYALVMTLPP